MSFDFIFPNKQQWYGTDNKSSLELSQKDEVQDHFGFPHSWVKQYAATVNRVHVPKGDILKVLWRRVVAKVFWEARELELLVEPFSNVSIYSCLFEFSEDSVDHRVRNG